MTEKLKPKIVLTGFGPFMDHKINDSWEAAKLLKNDSLENELGVEIDTLEIPVSYVESQKCVEKIWSNDKPCLVIHMGVHNRDNIVIEKLARRGGYCKPDVDDCTLNNFICPFDGGECIHSRLNLEKLIECVPNPEIPIALSENAGNYLCEYTYYLSLCKNNKALFIHVPPRCSCVPLDMKVKVLKDIIKAAYQLATEVKS